MYLLLDKRKQNTLLPKIMRASIHLFVEKGIDSTTVKDIARKAGVAEGALYRHFKSKDDLAWHIFSTHLNHFTTELMARVMSKDRACDRLRVFVHECFAAFEKDRELFTYLILSEHKEFKKYPAHQLHPGHVLMKIVTDGQSSGDLRTGEPLLLVSLVMGAVIRVCVTRMYGDLHQGVDTCEQAVYEALWAMLHTQTIPTS